MGSVTKLLKVIQETIDAGRIQMTDEEAVILYKEKIGAFIQKHQREPSLSSTDPLERRMAEAIFVFNVFCIQKRKHSGRSCNIIGITAIAVRRYRNPAFKGQPAGVVDLAPRIAAIDEPIPVIIFAIIA